MAITAHSAAFPGWHAVLTKGDPSQKIFLPVAVWAFDAGSVYGLVSDGGALTNAENITGFKYYLAPEQHP